MGANTNQSTYIACTCCNSHQCACNARHSTAPRWQPLNSDLAGGTALQVEVPKHGVAPC